MIINSKNKRVFQTCLFVLIAIVVLGIGYASISAINLIINGNATASVNQNNFKVHFIEAQNITGTTGVGGTSIIESDDTKASFTVTGLSKVGDYAEAKYVVKNDSNGIGAEITLELMNSNPEYFKVTETVQDNKLQAGDTTFATVKVEMTKTPISDDVSTSVTAKLIANPIENSQAIGNEQDELIKPIPFVYSINRYSEVYTNINQPFPNEARLYSSFAAASMDYGHPVCLAHKVEDNIIKESYVVFEMKNKLNYLRVYYTSDYSISDNSILESNANTLIDVFGVEKCQYNSNNYQIICRDNDLGVSAISTNGRVRFASSNWGCEINGSSGGCGS